MQVRRVLILALVLPAGVSTAGEECFCISNERYGYYEWGCLALTASGPDAVVCLVDGDDGPVPGEFTLDEDWQRVEEGDESCMPCMPDVATASLPDRFRSLYDQIMQQESAAE